MGFCYCFVRFSTGSFCLLFNGHVFPLKAEGRKPEKVECFPNF